MTDDRRLRGRGVTGYVAAFRRLDRPPATPRLTPAAAPIDITPAPPPATTSASSLRQQRRQVLCAAVAVAAVLAGGVAYAGVRPGERSRPVVLPTASLPTMPFGRDTVPPSGAAPAAVPVTQKSSRSAPAPGPSPAGPAGAADSGGAASGPDGAAAGPGDPGTGPDGAAVVLPVAPVAAPTLPEPAALPSAPVPAPGPRLAATFTGGGEWTADGLTGYRGTVRLENSGELAASEWQVTLTVPGGPPVSSDGTVAVTVTQDGDAVTFAPAGPDGAVPSGGSVSFGFTADGVLSAAPYGCAVDGHPSS